MRRKRRWVWRVLIVVFILGAILAGLLLTSTGARWVLRAVAPAHTIGDLSGNLVGPLTLSDVVVDTPNVTIKYLQVDWLPSHLLQGHLSVTQLNAKDVMVKVPQPRNQKRDRVDPAAAVDSMRKVFDKWPVPVPATVTQARLENIVISTDQSRPIDVASVDVENLRLDKTITAESLQVDSSLVDMQLSGSVDVAANGRIDLVSTWRAHQRNDLPVIQGETTIAGPWQDLGINQALRSPLELSIAAQLQNLRAGTPAWQAQLNLPSSAIQELISSTGPVRLSTDIEASGDLVQFTATGSGEVDFDEQTVTFSDLSIDADLDRFKLQSVELRSALGLARVAGAAHWQTPVSWQLNVNASDVSLASLDAVKHAQFNEPVAHGSVQLQGVGATMQGEIDMHVANTELAPWLVTGTVNYQDDTLVIERMVAKNETHADPQLQLEGQLGVVVGDWQRWPLALKARWQSMTWPLPSRVAAHPLNDARALLDAGELNVTGTVDNYQLQLDTDYLVEQRVQGAVVISGEGSTRHFDATSVATHLLGGTITGNAYLDWQDAPSWKTELLVDGLKPESINADWSGDLSARVKSGGGVVEDALQASVNVSDVKGMLLGFPVTGSFEASLDNAIWDIKRSQLSSGESSLLLAGQYGANSALDWQLVSKDMASLFPDATGQLAARGTIEGRADAPRLRGTFDAKALQLQGRSLANAEGRIDVDLSGREPWQLDTRASTLRISDTVVIDALSTTIDGDAKQHRVTVAASGREVGALQMSGEGRLLDSTWSFVTDQLNVTPVSAKTWRQLEPMRVSVDGPTVTVEPVCLVQDKQKICASATRSNEQTRAQAEVTGFNLSTANAWLRAQQMELTGTVDGRLDSELSPNDEMKFQGSFDIDTAQVTYTEENSTRHVMSLRSVVGSVEQNDQFEASVQGQLGDGGEFKGTMQVNDRLAALTDSDAAIQGTLNLSVPDVSTLPFSGISEFDVEGKVQLEAQIAGTAENPQLELVTRYRDGAMTVTQTGARLTEFSVDATTQDEQTVVVDAKFNANDKPVAIKGTVHLDNINQVTASLKLTGERVPVVSLPEALIEASPDLSISIKENLIETTGVITIDRAELRLEEAQSEVSISDDVIIESSTQATPGPSGESKPRRLRTRVTVQLGEDATIEAAGFVGRLSGSPVIVDKGDGLITALGDITIVEGEYTIFGQTLPIEFGRFSYADTNISNPLLDIAASREVDGVVARVRVSGSADNPSITFESQPPLQDSDVISYLLFQRPVAALSAADSLALVRLAASLRKNKKRKVPLRGRIAAALGLPDLQFTVDTTDTDTAVVVGSQLSSKFYLGYAIGLFDTASRLLLRYKLTENLSLQSELGKSSGADLQYSLER